MSILLSKVIVSASSAAVALAFDAVEMQDRRTFGLAT